MITIFVLFGGVSFWLLTPVYGETTLLNEEFHTLDSWRPFTFNDEIKPTQYRIHNDSVQQYLSMTTDASASGLVWSDTILVTETVAIKWRWRVDSIYQNLDETTKAGDDFPLRVFVLFVYEPENAPFLQALSYAAAKRIYGFYPPLAALGYVWSSRSKSAHSIQSPYSEVTQSIPLRTGESETGVWVAEDRSIMDDYRMIFGKSPPSRMTIAIMSDSDNSGQRTTAALDGIELYNK
ncbi:MAG: DUF3047 domain-containing protein [Fibrobacterales bacterium]